MDTNIELDFGSNVGAKDTDYVLSKLPKPDFRFADNKIEYNQNLINAYSCTLFGTMGCVSDLTGYVFSTTDQKEIFDLAVQKGLDPKIGWSLSDAVDLVRKWWNEKQSTKLMSFRIERTSKKFFEALASGYSLAIAFRGNSKYNNDKNDDGELDNTSFGLTTYGHIVRSTLVDGNITIVDNYKGITHNTYTIPLDNWDKLANFYASAYIFVVEEEYKKENGNDTPPSWAKESWEKYSNLFDSASPNKEVDLESIQWVFHKLGYIEKPTEPLTQARLTVLLNRIIK